MFPNDYFPEGYFGSYFGDEEQDPGSISAQINAAATVTANLGFIDHNVQDDPEHGAFIGRAKRRKRREEQDLKDLHALIEKLIHAQAA